MALSPDLTTSNTKFALQVYNKLASNNPDGNIFFSPISISVALAMTYLGARGNTRKQMKKQMFLEEIADDETVHQSFLEMMHSINDASGKSYSLHMANKLFGEQSYHFLPDFLDRCKQFYGTDVSTVNFRDEPGQADAAKKINKWVSEQTKNTIPKIASPGDFNDLTRLVLINAIYFKGHWMTIFDKSQTHNADFRITKENIVKVPLMYMGDKYYNYGFHTELNCQALELPYKGGNLSMFVILPDDTKTDLHQVEIKLVEDHLLLTNVRTSFRMGSHKMRLWLPKFKLNETMDLTGTLSRMGMDDLFTEEQSDLSGIDGTKELFVSKVLHRAFVDVNEEGTVAAAVTYMRTSQVKCIKPPPVTFRADHPFLFVIQHSVTGSILFIGRYQNPKIYTANQMSYVQRQSKKCTLQ